MGVTRSGLNQVTALRDRVLAAERDAGRDPDEITCVHNVEVRVAERAGERPNIVTAEAVAERLISFGELGFTAIKFMPFGSGQAELLSRDVIPAVRAARP